MNTKKMIILFLLGLTEISLISAQTLKIGILPDIDSLPLMLAEDEALYDRFGVDVELVSFSNPQERDAAFQSGRIDAAVSDLLAAAFFIAGGFEVRVTSLTDGRYGLVASPQSGIHSLQGFSEKRIGLSTNTIIQYAVDSLMDKNGPGAGAYTPVSVPRMPVRMELVISGALDGAGLPEPLLSAAVQKGAVLVAATDQLHIDAGVLLFDKKVLDTRLDAVTAFYKAYEAACMRIMADPDSYRPYLVDKAGFPAEIRDSFVFVPYRKPQVPEQEQIEAVLNWLNKHDLLSRPVTADELVDDRPVAAWK